MKTKMRHILGLGISLVIPAILTGLVGCTTETRTFQPPSAEIREQLGSSSAHLHHTDVRVALFDPNSGAGAGALHGAGAGAGVGAAVGAAPGVVICQGTIFGCVIGLPLAIVMGTAGAIAGGVVGTGIGAGIAHSEEEVMAASDSLRSALARAKLADDLSAHLQAASALHGVQDLLLPSVTESIAEEVEESQQGRSGNRLEIAPQLAIDALGEWDPDLSIRITAHAHLRRGGDQAVVYRRGWEYRSPWEGYFDLAENDARRLRIMIDTGLSELADSIVLDLFVESEPEIHALGPVPAGEVWTTMTWTAAEVVPRPEQMAVAQQPSASGHSPPTVDVTKNTGSAPSEAPAYERPAITQDPREASSGNANEIGDASAPYGRFGAIAISTTSTFRSGACVNEPTPEAAESCALKECGRHCEVHVEFGADQCAAVTGYHGVGGVRGDSPQNRWRVGDSGVGASATAALESAKAECRGDTRNCAQLVRPVCNG